MLVRPVGSRPPLFYRGADMADVLPLLGVFVAWSLVPTILTWWFGRPLIDLTSTPFSIVGLALSILLGFRNNACYDRWWEGRKTWGRLVNTSRSLARQLLTMPLATGEDTEALRAWQDCQVRRVIGFAYALKHHLRDGHSVDELDRFLPVNEVAWLHNEVNIPNALTHRLGEALQEAHQRGWVHPMHVPTIEASLVELTDIQGVCERIKFTPLPLPYSVLTHRIVLLYCLTLPFGLVSTVGAWTPVVVVVMAFAFLGLDDVGTQLEDPFERDPNDLPLDALSRRIEIDLRQRLGDHPLPPVVEPVNHVLL